MDKKQFLNMVDHTILNANITKQQLIEVLDFANSNSCASVCINPTNIEFAKSYLNNSNLRICTVIGFPLGANTTETKVFETENAIKNGANEIDMVINISQLKNKNYDYVIDEIKKIRNVTNDILKVIIENAYLTKDEIKIATQMCVDANADFVKTSTGFAPTGALVEDVNIMKDIVKNKIRIKAAGGIKNLQQVIDLYNAGASRFGLSRTKDILKEF